MNIIFRSRTFFRKQKYSNGVFFADDLGHIFNLKPLKQYLQTDKQCAITTIPNICVGRNERAY